MSEEERQAIIHLLDKQARYEYCINNSISFSDEDYEAYIIRQSMINKDKEIERLNKEVEKYKKRCYEALTLIRKNYGLLDKYGIDMLDDILNGK